MREEGKGRGGKGGDEGVRKAVREEAGREGKEKSGREKYARQIREGGRTGHKTAKGGRLC